jgi:predicted AlkP superfamily phosphohydrolase/phosphomutase
MGHCLDEALKLRNRIAQWLMSERLPDWDLAIIVASEFHSALEALWHGWDPDHPLHNVPSAAPAREGIVRLYRTLDVMLKGLRNRYPDAVLCLFSPHGMGPNTSDLPAMALVPELMFRDAFRKPLLRAHPFSTADGDVPPLLHPESWSRSVLPYLTTGSPKASGKRWTKLRKWFAVQGKHRGSGNAGTQDLPLDWMPASHYQPFWRDMRAFALPSFYDARIRINLKGREAAGLVEMADYKSELDRVEQLIRELRDYRTNEPVTTKITRPAVDDPLGAEKSQCDLKIVWSSNVCGFIHPLLGKIGPLPMRRTGGHTGGYGLAAFANTTAKPGNHGVRSTFDLVPTLVKLLGEEKLARELNGNFLL